LLFGSEFLSLRPPEGLTPSTSIPGSLSLSGSKRRSRRFAPCLAHLNQCRIRHGVQQRSVGHTRHRNGVRPASVRGGITRLLLGWRK
jgi:hypothetical protein